MCTIDYNYYTRWTALQSTQGVYAVRLLSTHAALLRAASFLPQLYYSSAIWCCPGDIDLGLVRSVSVGDLCILWMKYSAARLADKLHYNSQLTVESWPGSLQFSVCAKPPDWAISKDPMRLVPSAASRAWIIKPRNTSPIAMRDTVHTTATHNNYYSY